MNVTLSTQILIDPVLASKGDFSKAVEQSLSFLKSVPGVEIDKLAASWSLDPLNEPTVELTMKMDQGSETFQSRRSFPLQHMFDPVNRDIWTLRTYGDLVAKKSAYHMNRLDRMIMESMEEERNGQAVAQ